MENTSIIALSRQGALSRQMGVIANNLANMNTSGFKAERMMFIEHLERSRGGERLLSEKLAFVRDIATMRDTSEGPLQKTGNPLDIANRGEGYFVVDTDQGQRYTRNGRFQLNQQGEVVNQAGHRLLSDTNQPFALSPEDKKIDVSRDGVVSTENGELGRIQVVRFANDQQLRVAAGGLFSTDQAPEKVANPDLVQNMLEGSNIEPIREMTRMIAVQRAYDSARMLINREDERMKTMIEELAKQV